MCPLEWLLRFGVGFWILTTLDRLSLSVCWRTFGLFPALLLLSYSVVSDSLWPHEPQHARLLWPPLSPRVCSIHAQWVRDAIQPSHPLSSSSPCAFNLSQHQCLFQWVGSSHQVVKVLGLQFPAWDCHKFLCSYFCVRLSCNFFRHHRMHWLGHLVTVYWMLQEMAFL